MEMEKIGLMPELKLEPLDPSLEPTRLQRRSFGSSGSSAASPETEEFESLERRLTQELQQRLQERRLSEQQRIAAELSQRKPSQEFCPEQPKQFLDSSEQRKSSLDTPEQRKSSQNCHEQWKSPHKDPEPRKPSQDGPEQRKPSQEQPEDDQLSLQLLEKRQLRTFSRADEYLYAMKEDLAEWLNLLYPWIQIHPETFMDKLQTGEHLLRVSFFSSIT